MPLFAYRARNSSGELIAGRTEATSKEALEKNLENQGLIPITVVGSRPAFEMEKVKSFFGRVSPDDLIVFTRQIGTMYKAGIPFVRTIKATAEQTENKALKKILTTVREDVESGKTFADTLSMHPKIFNELYVNMVAAGEAGGVMDEILNRLSTLLEKDADIKAKIKSATLYPKMVVGAIVAAIVILITFVIPKFAELYGRFGAALPLPTRVLVAISIFFTKYWYIMALAVIVSVISFRIYIRTGIGRRHWDSLRIRFPIFGPLSLKASMSRFSMILGTLLKSGLPILTALEISGRAIGNVIVSDEVERIRSEIREGKPLAKPMEESGFFPAMMIQMIAVGEETGKLDDMLLGVSDHLNSEVDYTIRNLSTLLEPMLLSVIFGMVLFIALALFLPMWDMVKLVRGGR